MHQFFKIKPEMLDGVEIWSLPRMRQPPHAILKQPISKNVRCMYWSIVLNPGLPRFKDLGDNVLEKPSINLRCLGVPPL